MIDPNWISAIANCIMALGVIFAWRQIKLFNLQLKADHDRSRREKAIDLGCNWVRNLNDRASDAENIVGSISVHDINRIWSRESLVVDEKLIPVISRVFPGKSFEANNGLISITSEQSAELRWLVVSYLNELEVVLSAWANGVADREMIEQEFSFLVNSNTSRFCAERFREIAPIGSWPAIYLFVNKFRNGGIDHSGKDPLFPS